MEIIALSIAAYLAIGLVITLARRAAYQRAFDVKGIENNDILVRLRKGKIACICGFLVAPTRTWEITAGRYCDGEGGSMLMYDYLSCEQKDGESPFWHIVLATVFWPVAVAVNLLSGIFMVVIIATDAPSLAFRILKSD